MAETGPTGPGQHPRFHEDLVGLDPHDPEACAFAEHLDRMERCRPNFTVEASIDGVADFADSSNRLGGLRWWIAAFLATLIIVGVIVAAWDIVERALLWLAE